MKRTPITAGLVFILVLTIAAFAAVQEDDFDDNTMGPLWVKEVDLIRVKERDKKLKFRSAAAGGGERQTGYAANGWYFDFTRSYTFKFKYKMAVESVSGSKWAAVGGRIYMDADVDEAYVYVRRDAQGLWIIFESRADDTLHGFREAPLPWTKGTIKVRYAAGTNRLKVYANGVLMFQIDDLVHGDEPNDPLAELAIGAARKGFVEWGWNDVWLDKFWLKGVIVVE